MSNKAITVFVLILIIFLLPLKSNALLIWPCGNLNYVSLSSSVIAEGKVIKIDVKREEKGIFTYTDFQVEKYIKGEGGNIITIRTGGGCLEEKCQWVEDTPTFKIGERGFLYLREGEKGTFSVVCGSGIIDKLAPIYSIYLPIGLLLLILLVIFILWRIFTKRKKISNSSNKF